MEKKIKDLTDEMLEEILNKAFDYGVQATLDNLLIRGYNTKKMLDQEFMGKRLDDDLDKEKNELIKDIINSIRNRGRRR